MGAGAAQAAVEHFHQVMNDGLAETSVAELCAQGQVLVELGESSSAGVDLGHNITPWLVITVEENSYLQQQNLFYVCFAVVVYCIAILASVNNLLVIVETAAVYAATSVAATSSAVASR